MGMLAIDPNQLTTAPIVTITNKSGIPGNTAADSIRLSLHAADPGGAPLVRLFCWVNRVPIHADIGSQIQNPGSSVDIADLRVPLSRGSNRVDVCVANDAGVRSLVESVVVQRDATPFTPTLNVIVIGVSNYQNPNY